MEKEIDSQGKRRAYARNQILRLAIALLVLLGIVITFILYLSWPLLTGTTAVLATMPIDPFDILRGQYLTIRYEISQIPIIEEANEGDTAYIQLTEDSSQIWRYKKASLIKPEGVFIKGKIISKQTGTMRIEYGIEQYFFEKDAHIETRNMTVKVKISSSGQARILELLQDGKPLEIRYKNASITS